MHGLTLVVPEGGIVSLLGANGAGKSSVLRAICGLVPARAGTIELAGHPLDRTPAGKRVEMGIGTVPEGRLLFRSLTVEENLRAGAYRRHDGAEVGRDLQWIYGLFPVLSARRDARADLLSGGQGQMLAIGRALMTRPRLLLLDEPSHGLAPNLVDEIFDLIVRLRTERHLSILLVEQNANRALTVADYGYVLEAGTLKLEGAGHELARDPRVKPLYLGL